MATTNPPGKHVAWPRFLLTVSERVYRSFYPDARLSGTLLFYEAVRREVRAGMRVLNLGAGPGDQPQSTAFAIRDVRGHGWTVYGCDPDPAVLTNAQIDEARRMDPADVIPYEDAFFDLVFCDYVLEHVAKPTTFLFEVHRVLKPGGALHFRTPNLYHYVSLAARCLPHAVHIAASNRARRLATDAHEPYPTFHRLNTRRRLRRLSTAAGFRETSLVMIEAEPSYLMFNTFAFLTGVAYERMVNRFTVLQGIRANIVGRMVK